jgi:hypothetical protein
MGLLAGRRIGGMLSVALPLSDETDHEASAVNSSYSAGGVQTAAYGFLCISMEKNRML